LQKQLESMHIEILNIEIKKHNEFYMVEMVVSLPENYHATEMLKLFQHCDYIEEVNI
jgi:predicted amino acid-binding ACT domain protein